MLLPSTTISLTSDASFQIKFNLLIIIVTLYINQVESHLQLKPISEIDISNIINNLKNKASYGHDEISNKLIKRTGPALIKSLTLMVNQMLFTGIFPDSLKWLWFNLIDNVSTMCLKRLKAIYHVRLSLKSSLLMIANDVQNEL